MSPPKELRTRRLRLRPLVLDDADAVFGRWASLPEVPRWMVWARHESLDDARDFLESVREANASGASRDWMIETESDHEPIGTIGLQTLSASSCELGYVLAPVAWGCGFATEAAAAVTDAAFGDPEIVRVQAHCHPANVASLRVLAKCGFEIEGRLRKCRVLPNLGDEPQDLLILSRVR